MQGKCFVSKYLIRKNVGCCYWCDTSPKHFVKRSVCCALPRWLLLTGCTCGTFCQQLEPVSFRRLFLGSWGLTHHLRTLRTWEFIFLASSSLTICNQAPTQSSSFALIQDRLRWNLGPRASRRIRQRLEICGKCQPLLNFFRFPAQ